MAILSKQNNKKRRNQNFVPAWSAMVGHGRLEGRALTAPAIFRRPPSDPASALDSLWAVATNQPINTGVNTAGNATTVTNGSTSAVGASNIVVVDLINPNPPAAPIGSGEINFSTNESITSSGSFADLVNLSVGTSINRSYVLADTIPPGTPTPPAFLDERFTLNYQVSSNGITVMDSILATPGLSIRTRVGMVEIGAGGDPLLQFTNGTDTSGTLTQGSSTITYTVSISRESIYVNVREVRPLGSLPGAGTNPDGTATGIPWNVNYTEGITFGGSSATQTLTSNYKLDVSYTTPPV